MGGVTLQQKSSQTSLVTNSPYGESKEGKFDLAFYMNTLG